VTAAVHGDPASCSHVGGSLRHLAARLRTATTRAQDAQTDLGEEWSGRVARTVGRRTAVVVETATAAAAELDRTGALLQDHATDLAEALQSVRAVEERAQGLGLSVIDGRVEPRWGVTGVADEDALAAREQRRAELQAELDHVVLQLSRRRARLASALEAAQSTLADHSAVLRE
jgi:hypothetical protein